MLNQTYELLFGVHIRDLLDKSFCIVTYTSTKHALLKFTDDILKCFDDNKVGITTFMDLSKAFDSVDHKMLLTKIKRYGVHSTPLQWIRSYLSNREHFVSWNQIQSTSSILNIGVIQGSILGPLLFLIHINDIVNSSNVLPFVLFTDDTTVYVLNNSIDGAIEILNTELAKVALWFDSNILTLNVNKTQMIMLSRKQI